MTSAQAVFAAQSREQAQVALRTRSHTKPRVLLAGGAGVLGSVMLERLSGSVHWQDVTVFTQDTLQSSLQNVLTLPSQDTSSYDEYELGVIVLDQPRNFHERERVFWMPEPQDLLQVALRMQSHRVKTLAIIVPHLQASLPQSLKAGLASLDEQAVSALGFDRLLILRPSRAQHGVGPSQLLPSVAAWMLKQLSFMIPERDRPVRAIKLAAFADEALHAWHTQGSKGTRVIAPEVLWQAAAAQDIHRFASRWAADALSPAFQTTKTD